MSSVTFARSFDRLYSDTDLNKLSPKIARRLEIGADPYLFNGKTVVKGPTALVEVAVDEYGSKSFYAGIATKAWGKVSGIAVDLDDAFLAEVKEVKLDNWADIRLTLGDTFGATADAGQPIHVTLCNVMRGTVDATGADTGVVLDLGFVNSKSSLPDQFRAKLSQFDDHVTLHQGTLSAKKAQLGGGADTNFDLGAGNDTFTSEPGFRSNDTVKGGFGDDQIYGGAGNDLLFGDQDTRQGSSALDIRIKVSFVSESGSYGNVFGYYDRQTGEAHILHLNSDLAIDPGLVEFEANLNLTLEQYQHLEFFLIPNGYWENAWLQTADLAKLELVVTERDGHGALLDLQSGEYLDGRGVDGLFTENWKNPGNSLVEHEVSQSGSERDYNLGWEDSNGEYDNDYNDAVFNVKTWSEHGVPGDDWIEGGSGDDHIWGGQDQGRYAITNLVEGDFDLLTNTFTNTDAVAIAQLDEFGNIVLQIEGTLQAVAQVQLTSGDTALLLVQLTGELYGAAEIVITNDFLTSSVGSFEGNVTIDIIPVDGLGALNTFSQVDIIGGDVLGGGVGRDTFWFNDGDGVDTILDFEQRNDFLKLEKGEKIRQTVVEEAERGKGLLIEHGGDGDAVFLVGIEAPLSLVASGGGYDTYQALAQTLAA